MFFELNEGQAQESHRRYTLPPTVTAAETGDSSPARPMMPSRPALQSAASAATRSTRTHLKSPWEAPGRASRKRAMRSRQPLYQSRTIKSNPRRADCEADRTKLGQPGGRPLGRPSAPGSRDPGAESRDVGTAPDVPARPSGNGLRRWVTNKGAPASSQGVRTGGQVMRRFEQSPRAAA